MRTATTAGGVPGAVTEDMVRERLQVWRDSGVTSVRLPPAGKTLGARLHTLGRALDLVRVAG